jgi:2-aminoadipate transaminase
MSDSVQTTQMHVDPSVIDFGVGQPQLSLLPLDRIRAAAELRFARGDPAFLQYGAEQGDGFLRSGLARYLEQAYGFPVGPSELFITNGASQGLDLICTLFTRPGDTIFVEEPSYFLALRIFADHHLNVVPLPMDADGLVIEALEEQLKTTRPVLLYTIPTFQNPSGYTLSEARRARLAQLSREHSFTIVADEVYHLLNFTARPPRPLAGYIDQGNILSLGSFSKILAPGLRLGWIQAAPQHTQAFAACGLLDSGGGLNPFTSGIVRGLLETDELQEHIQHLCAVYSQRVAAMDAALRSELPEAAYLTPRGGYFFWVRLPGGRDAQEFLQHAERYKVSFRPGVRFSSQAGLHDYARLCFAFYEAGQLAEGIGRLKQALA